MVEGDWLGKIIFTESFSKRQYLYFLRLKAEMLPEMMMPAVSCELGKEKTINVEVKNPLSKPIVYQVTNSNTDSFSAP